MNELDTKTRETLERQFQLLSERSAKASDADLANLTYAMTDIVRMLRARVQTGSQPDRSAGGSACPSSASQLSILPDSGQSQRFADTLQERDGAAGKEERLLELRKILANNLSHIPEHELREKYEMAYGKILREIAELERELGNGG